MCHVMVVGRSTGHAKSLGNSGVDRIGSDGGQYVMWRLRRGIVCMVWYIGYGGSDGGTTSALIRRQHCRLALRYMLTFDVFHFFFRFHSLCDLKTFKQKLASGGSKNNNNTGGPKAGGSSTHTHRYTTHTHKPPHLQQPNEK